MDAEPPGTVSEGCGGAKKRMKAAKCSMSLRTSNGGFGVPIRLGFVLVPSLGILTAAFGHASSRSVWNSSLEMHEGGEVFDVAEHVERRVRCTDLIGIRIGAIVGHFNGGTN